MLNSTLGVDDCRQDQETTEGRLAEVIFCLNTPSARPLANSSSALATTFGSSSSFLIASSEGAFEPPVASPLARKSLRSAISCS